MDCMWPVKPRLLLQSPTPEVHWAARSAAAWEACISCRVPGITSCFWCSFQLTRLAGSREWVKYPWDTRLEVLGLAWLSAGYCKHMASESGCDSWRGHRGRDPSSQHPTHLLRLLGPLLPLLGGLLFFCYFFFFFLFLSIFQSSKFILRLRGKTQFSQNALLAAPWRHVPVTLTFAFPFDFSSFLLLPLSPGCCSSDTAWWRHTHTKLYCLRKAPRG